MASTKQGKRRLAAKAAAATAAIATIQPAGGLQKANGRPAAVYLARLGPGSRRGMLQALQVLARLLTDGTVPPEALPWHLVRYQHAAAIRARLAAMYAPRTVNRYLTALRGVLKECWRLGLLDADTYGRTADVEAIKVETLPAGRALGQDERLALFEACGRDTGSAGRRDAAVLAVLYGGGLRRAEVVALDLEDVDLTAGSLKVAGKGGKERLAYLSRSASQLLSAWLDVRGREHGPLFVSVKQGREVGMRRLSAPTIRGLLVSRAAQAGIRHFTAHDLRRSFISDLLNAGADIAVIQRLAGHASPVTTSRYDRRGEVAKRRAAELIAVPPR